MIAQLFTTSVAVIDFRAKDAAARDTDPLVQTHRPEPEMQGNIKLRERVREATKAATASATAAAAS